MGVDLKLVNRIWGEAKNWEKKQSLLISEEDIVHLIPYSSALAIVSCLLENKKLAQEIVDETWEGSGLECEKFPQFGETCRTRDDPNPCKSCLKADEKNR